MVLHDQLIAQYSDMSKWAIHTYGVQNGLDFLHDGVVKLLEVTPILDLSDMKLMGLWRIHIQQAYGQYRKRQGLQSMFDENDELLAKHMLRPQDAAKEARNLVRYMLPHIPPLYRHIITRLYVYGYTLTEYVDQTNLTRKQVECLHAKALTALGALVTQDNLRRDSELF